MLPWLPSEQPAKPHLMPCLCAKMDSATAYTAGEASAQAATTPVRDGVWFSDTIDVSTLVCIDYETEEDMQRTSHPPAGVSDRSVSATAGACQTACESSVHVHAQTRARARAHDTTRHDTTRHENTARTRTRVRALTDELMGGH